MPISLTSTRIRVVPVHLLPPATVLGLGVAADQRVYVGDIALNVADAERDPLSDAMVVLAGERPVGFYRLDRALRTVCGHEMDEPALGLRALFIDQRVQGRGYGRAAIEACCEDARQRYPERRLLILSVNGCNQAAIATYLSTGFHDTGERLPGGAAATQLLMIKRLQPAAPAVFAPIRTRDR
ncbi:MAG: GNAT family N-acetyltransferase [Pseudomonadota bacterium]|nr:GNAT family N-acetyltransferase [Pseudomonadota bacterium]